MIIRLLDLGLALIGLVLFMPLIFVLLVGGLFDTGSPIFIQTRMGKHKKPFKLIKLRTMKIDTPTIASHLVGEGVITPLGKFLRRYKIDELPQLINVLKGEMSFVGPRPNLLNQDELIQERERFGLYRYRPGITGMAQIRRIDMSCPQLLARVDDQMMTSLTVRSYLNCLLQTVMGGGYGDACMSSCEAKGDEEMSV